MPRERRLALAENLERFAKLDPPRQAAIRTLDARLSSLNPVDQARYRATLRRYHAWVGGLTDEQRRRLDEAPNSEARFALAREMRLQEMQSGSSGPRLAGIRIGDFGLIGPYEAAHMLRVWNKLSPTRKAELEHPKERIRLFATLRADARSVGVRFEPFPAEEEATYTARIEAEANLKSLLGPLNRQPDTAPRKAESVLKKADLFWKRAEHPFAEFFYFEEHRPRPVSQGNLERFAASTPPWFQSMIDPLSPDDAREYLTILYRLLYPHPSEMPGDMKSPSAPSRPSASPKVAPGKAANAGSF